LYQPGCAKRAAKKTTGSFNCSIKERGKNTIIVETEVPSKEANCDVPITEEASNVTEDHYRAEHLRSPSIIRDESIPLDDAEILTSRVLGQG